MKRGTVYLLLIFVSLVIMAVQPALAIWIPDGVPAALYQIPDPGEPQIASDGAGGAIVTWLDYRGGSYSIYAQRTDASGTILWTIGGEVVCTVAGDQTDPRIISDGAGGAIVAWHDNRSGDYDIYAQRIDASGTVQWTTDGVPLCTATTGQYWTQVASDGAGGAIVTWYEARSGNNDIYAQRINASGTVQWTVDGVPLCTLTEDQRNPQVTSDGAGGAIVTWLDDRGSNWDIYAQRINASGTVQWTTDGVPLCEATQMQDSPRITPDGAGGAIVTWRDYRSVSNYDIYAQRINASGTVQWIVDGVPICTATGTQERPEVTFDGAGGAIVTWQDGRSGTFDIYAQLMNASGTAQWATDGVPICAAAGTQSNPQVTSDGAGGAIVTWQDIRGSNWDIYAQRINTLGTVQWTAYGVPLCTASGNQSYPLVTSDGAGGEIVTWQDERSGNNEIYTQRINVSGTVQWTSNGAPLCTATGNQERPEVTFDGTGGAIVTWQDERRGTWDISAQRIDTSGTVQWTTDGVILCAAIGNQYYPQVTSDGVGGAIVTWQDERSGYYDIYAQRIDASGTVQWTSDGVILCAATGGQEYPQITSDGAGGAIVTWQDYRAGTNIYAQRVDASGTVQWTIDGVPLCTATGNQISPQVTSDGGGGAIVTWLDLRSGNYDIYAQRIDASGTVLWTTDGVPLCAATGNQSNPQITSNGAGGAIVTWRDDRGSSADIYAQRLNALGTVQWAVDGVPLCTATGNQSGPHAEFDGSGGAIVIWQDERSGIDGDLYAQRINVSGTTLWTTDGVPLCVATGHQGLPQVIFDGVDGAIVTWRDERSGNHDIYAQRIDASGIVQWTTDGVPLCTATGSQTSPQVTSDGAGGAIVTWYDERSGEYNVYIQRTTDHGMGPVCEIYPEIIDIPGTIQAGTYFDATFTITNIGFGTLIGYVEEACDDFDIVSGGGSFGLNNGQSRIVTVRFEPSDKGAYECVIETGMYLCSDVTITGTAYACPPDSVLYVDDDATGVEDGTSWTDAFTSLQDGLARAVLCDNVKQIWVADGTYYPTDGTNRESRFQLRDSLAIYGGFAGTESALSERDLFVSTSVLSGDIGVAGDQSDNCYHVMTGFSVDSTAVLDGFTISEGNADAPGHVEGGGMYNDSATPLLRNIFFRDNSAAENGGGMYNQRSSDPVMYNMVFYHNTAGQFGGGIYNAESSPRIVNATFYANYSDDSGAGIFNEGGSNPVLINTIMWEDSTSNMIIPEIANHNFSYPVISYSLVMDCGGSGGGWESGYGTDGGNNIDDNPLFIEDLGGDLRLLSGSPAIDAGDSTIAGLPETDIDGNPRIQKDIDMGAYEGVFDWVGVSMSTSPEDLAIIIDGDTVTTSIGFTAKIGDRHEIGTITPQEIKGRYFSFTAWSDGGDTVHTVTVPDEPVSYTAYFSSAYLYSVIDSIVDVSPDQGGWARIYFKRSHYDNLSETVYPIERYDMHRRVDSPALAAMVLAEGKKSENGLIEYDGRYFVVFERPVIAPGAATATGEYSAAAPPGLWEVVGTVSAAQQEQYIGLVPTLADSAATIPWSVYYISAHSTTPAVYFDSPADSGYSVDNIAPGVPQGLTVAYNTGSGNQLSWDPSPEPDFQYYRIYRGTDESFVPGPGNLVHEMATEGWNDPEYDGWDVHYKITALDYVGNESGAASATSTTGDETPQVPDAFSLYQNAPNPFNPTTIIRFDLPRAEHVKLFVYNVKGELVSTIIDQHMTEGRKEVNWSATDNRGRAISSGVYFYRIIAGDFVQTRKMVLLK